MMGGTEESTSLSVFWGVTMASLTVKTNTFVAYQTWLCALLTFTPTTTASGYYVVQLDIFHSFLLCCFNKNNDQATIRSYRRRRRRVCDHSVVDDG
jgi:hypothetical protein